MKKIKLGIIGCGNVTRRHHLPVLIKDKRIEVSALCDENSEASKMALKRFGLSCPIFDNPAEFFSSSETEVVDICTPGKTHFLMAKQALNSGKHVLVEKPPVLNISDAHFLIDLANEKKLKIGTVFNNRYREILARLCQTIDRGMLGRVVKMHLVHHANIVYADSPYLWNEAESKYLIYEFGIHLFDFVVSVLGEHEKILSVVPIYQTSIQHTTEVYVTVLFRSGAIAHFTIAQDSTRHSTFKTHIHAYGTGMDAYARFFPPLIRFSAGIEHPITILLSEIRSIAKLGWLLLSRQWGRYQNQGHKIALTQYVDWISGGQPYPFTLEAVLPTLRLLDDISRRVYSNDFKET